MDFAFFAIAFNIKNHVDFRASPTLLIFSSQTIYLLKPAF